jgi:NADH-ubiquinone oxidoreductase chain 5
MVFVQKPKGSQQIAKQLHESGIHMLIPLIILSVGSIFSGYIFKDIFIGLGSDGFRNSIIVKNTHVNLLDAEFIPYFFKAIPLCFSTLGILIAFVTYNKLTIYYSKL